MFRKSAGEKTTVSKQELFANTPVPQALYKMAIPTIISQLINLIYNMVDAFFIGRTGNSYMMAATSLTLTLIMMNVAMSNLFGIGGGSLVARLMGTRRFDDAKKVSAFSAYGALAIALFYSLLVGLFLNPLLTFLGASDATIGFARSYTLIVTVIGCLPSILSLVLAHLLRNSGFSREASIGLSGGGILNAILDPLFMFVLLPKGQEVTGAAIATTLSNCCACAYMLLAYRKASQTAPLSFRFRDAASISRSNRRSLFVVGVPSALLTGLYDVASICVNMLASAHSDLVLAGIGIVLKVERIPNAVNVGICQGMLPIVAFNYASGNRSRMQEAIRTARRSGLLISAVCITFFELLAGPCCRVFLNTSAGDVETAVKTIGFATLFLRIRCLASPFQFINYHASFCMQAMGNGKRTMLHSVVRQLVCYIPMMFLLDRLFGETGLTAAFPVGEACGAIFALFLLRKTIRETS